MLLSQPENHGPWQVLSKTANIAPHSPLSAANGLPINDRNAIFRLDENLFESINNCLVIVHIRNVFINRRKHEID